MAASLLSGSNNYIRKYNKDIPVYPSQKDTLIKLTNGFYNPFCSRFYEKRISKLQELANHLPHIPHEIWCVILKFQMYLEDEDAGNYHNWLYSDYSLTMKVGMELRSRQLYLPNICGIVMNEGINIVKCGERVLKEKNNQKKIAIETLSKYFLNFIIRWYHWLLESTKYTINTSKVKFQHFIYQLNIKTKYFMKKEHYYKYTKNAKLNFYYADYFVNEYYPNYMWNCITYRDIDFEKFIFENDYYNKVYKKGMLLRNYKRINLFLHE